MSDGESSQAANYPLKSFAEKFFSDTAAASKETQEIYVEIGRGSAKWMFRKGLSPHVLSSP